MGHLQVKASLFAAGCLCELSEDFACVVLVKLNNMITSLTTSFDAKLVAARAFSKMGYSSLIASRAYKVAYFFHAHTYLCKHVRHLFFSSLLESIPNIVKADLISLEV